MNAAVIAERKARHVAEMNEIANRCFGAYTAEPVGSHWKVRHEPLNEWRRTSRQPELPEAISIADLPTVVLQMGGVLHGHPEVRPHIVYADPVAAGLEVLLGPDERRWRGYLANLLDERLGTFEQEIEGRIEQLVAERMERVLADRKATERQSNDVFQGALARLKEKARGRRLPTVDEAWEAIDLSTLFSDDE